MYYSSIDLYRDMSFLTTINNTGLIVMQFKVSNKEHAIFNYFASIGYKHQTIVESTSNWYLLHLWIFKFSAVFFRVLSLVQIFKL
jgi:hypothetical protein